MRRKVRLSWSSTIMGRTRIQWDRAWKVETNSRVRSKNLAIELSTNWNTTPHIKHISSFVLIIDSAFQENTLYYSSLVHIIVLTV